MTLICITRWEENGNYYEDHKIIGKEIPEEIAFQLVMNGDAEIIEVDDEHEP